MAVAETLSGQCLCGAVKFKAVPAAMEMAVCHCGMCRRWAGGAFMCAECASLEFEDERALGVFVSSAWGERLFCKQCGSSLVWRTKDRAHVAVSIHALDQPSAFTFTGEIFIDEKPSNYSFAEDTQKLTGQQVFEMFAPKEA